MKNTSLNPVFILDISFAGYGITRALHGYGMPIIGFIPKYLNPTSYSRYFDRLIYFEDEPGLEKLLKRLKEVAAEYHQKPVLMITGDKYVNFVMAHKEAIESTFLIHFPEVALVNKLIDKTALPAFAKEQDFLIPQTEFIQSAADLEWIKENLAFPIILKPYLRTHVWHRAKLPKAFLVHTFEELKSLYERISQVEPNLLVQEWIPGDDENVVFCLVYYNEHHQCIGQFTGSKIRQYPAGKGSTSVAIPYPDEKVAGETIRFFDAVSYTGFGSMEYKKHALNGRYYIIEPTVGRVDMQELVAALNGVNLPLIAYNALSGHAIDAKKAPKKAVIFINEFNEMKRLTRALFKGPYQAKNFINWSVKGKRVYAYSSWKDPLVGIVLIYKIMNMALRGVKRKLFS